MDSSSSLSLGATAAPTLIFRLVNHWWFQLASLMAFALIFNREGDRVPSGNEFVYLLYLWKAWHPQFLATDWTFQETTAGHPVFSYGIGWVTRLLSLEAAAWVGRVCCWAGVFAGLLRVGSYFKIQPWAIWFCILLWLAERQSLVTTEWMIGTFEAKPITYACLLFAIDAVLRDKIRLAGILCGIGFSFHTAVGMWGGAALGFAVLASNPIRKTVEFSLAVILFSLPGLITSIPMILGKHAISSADAKFLIVTSLPDCLDPFYFDKTSLVILAIIPIFAAMNAWRVRDDRSQRILFTFEIALAVFFFTGVAARAMGLFGIVLLYPMRTYAVFAMLLLFWQIASLIPGMALPGSQAKPSIILMVFAALLFLALPSPVLQFGEMITSRIPRLRHLNVAATMSTDADGLDFLPASKWIEGNTADSDIIIAPPWRNDAFYNMRRPQIANWHAPRYDALGDWRKRIECLVGDLTHADPMEMTKPDMGVVARTHYEQLSPADITHIQQSYGGNWLVTTSQYPYPVAYTGGGYVVYKLPATAPLGAGNAIVKRDIGR